MSRLRRTFRRIWAALVAVIAFVLALGVVQLKAVEWELPADTLRNWWPLGLGVLVVYVCTLEVLLPLAQRRHALSELRRLVIVDSLLRYCRSRANRPMNPVSLDRLVLTIEALPGHFPKDLKYTWEFEGTSNAAGPLAALEKTIVGGTELSALDMGLICHTEWNGRTLSVKPLLLMDGKTMKRMKLPFQGNGPDTSEAFKCTLEYTWPHELNPESISFFIDAGFSERIGRIDFSFTCEPGHFNALYMYEIGVLAGKYRFLGCGEAEASAGVFHARIKKPSRDYIYVLLAK